MKFRYLDTLVEKNILIITISNEKKLNALNKTVMKELEHAVTQAQGDEHVKAILITGAGNKSFVSGADIAEFIGLSKKQSLALSRMGQRVFRKIETSAKPVLAAVNGYALGGGCELAMACHLRVAGTNATFAQPEVNLGIVAGYGGTQRLIQYVGKCKALELHMTGEAISAKKALQLGLVNYVVPEKELLRKSKELLQNIISKSPVAIKGIIRSVNAYFNVSRDGFGAEAAEFSKCFEKGDFKEGVKAFLEKRKPVFKGK